MQTLDDFISSNELLTPIYDGKLYRFERRGKPNIGWMAAHKLMIGGREVLFVSAGDWSTGERWNWKSEFNGTPEETLEFKKKEKQIREQSDESKRAQQQAVAEECESIWAQSLESGSSPYIERKGLSKLYGARFNKLYPTTILIPLRDVDGKLWNLQRVWRDVDKGDLKGYWKGGLVKGVFHTIGEIFPKGRILVCEGFATGASIHEATGHAVVVAFMSSNLLGVCKVLREKYPESQITVCGDDDRWTKNGKGQLWNVGREAAVRAARAVKANVIFPSFINLDDHPTDFNDLHQREGADKVREQILSTAISVTPTLAGRLPIDFPDQNEKGKLAGTLENFECLFTQLGVEIKYNIISKEEEVRFPDKEFSMDNRANVTRAHLISWCERIGLPYANIDAYITAIAETNQYNPVIDWIESTEWDGTSRLKDIFDTVKAVNESSDPVALAMKETLIQTWLVSAVAALYEPNGVAAQGVLVFQGAQAMGKTSWFKKLVPGHLEFTDDGKSLDPDNKDSVTQVLSKWLVELGELDSTFRASLAKLKAFLTKDKDEVRAPYARKASIFPRRTVFFGSVNHMDFLKDPTGNRRFWVIECESIDYAHNINMQQLWAEVRELYKMGANWTLKQENAARLNESNLRFQEVEPIEEKIRMYFELAEDEKVVWLTATEVCEKLGFRNPTQRETRPAARVLRECSRHKPRTSRKPHRFAIPAKSKVEAHEQY